MPEETQNAVSWALTESVVYDGYGEVKVTKDTVIELVSKVREFFNTNNITYADFSFDDLKPYLETTTNTN